MKGKAVLFFVLSLLCAHVTAAQCRTATNLQALAEADLASIEATAEALEAETMAWEMADLASIAWAAVGEAPDAFYGSEQVPTLREEARKHRDAIENAREAYQKILSNEDVQQEFWGAVEPFLREEETLSKEDAAEAREQVFNFRRIAMEAEGNMMNAQANAEEQRRYAALHTNNWQKHKKRRQKCTTGWWICARQVRPTLPALLYIIPFHTRKPGPYSRLNLAEFHIRQSPHSVLLSSIRMEEASGLWVDPSEARENASEARERASVAREELEAVREYSSYLQAWEVFRGLPKVLLDAAQAWENASTAWDRSAEEWEAALEAWEEAEETE